VAAAEAFARSRGSEGGFGPSSRKTSPSGSSVSAFASAGSFPVIDGRVQHAGDQRLIFSVEHPHVVRNRILEAVDAVGGRERVIAGTDCGFSTLAGWELVAPSLVWRKFESMAEGARPASAALWGEKAA
jgi:hypothetical protein